MKKRKDDRSAAKKPICAVLNGASVICLVLSLLCGFVLPGVRFSGVLFFCLAALCRGLILLERRAERSGRWRTFRRIVWSGLAVGLAIFLAVEGMILSCGESEPEELPEVIIVLGAGVNGTTPSLTLQTRIRAAQAYLEEHPDTVAVLSGGQGNGEDITEAQAMYESLVRGGISAERLILEERSTSTLENFRFSREILRENGFSADEPVGVVTNDFHQFRAQRMADSLDISAVGIPAELPWWWLNANYYVREFFALGKWCVTGLFA